MRIEEMIAANRADCSGCESCANICPENAITMTRDATGFAYPKINPELCIKCGKCDSACPTLNFKAKAIEAFPPTFVATYQNDKILRRSSSGGAFTALSEIILNRGGVVFGAGFDKNWHVVHSAARTLDELENLRGSKYVQSQIGDVYRQVKDALKATSVLFSGTPCQCAGLKHFLGKDYDNLLTVEIVCHGTPPPGLWEDYIDELNYAHEIKHINFRSKRDGWKVAQMEIHFSDRPYYAKLLSKTPYGKMFLRGISERPSCHSCKFKFPNGQSDLILGDAWGVMDFAPEMYDNRGVSLIIVNTDKGNSFLQQANLKIQQVKFPVAVQKNNHVIISSIEDARSKKFFIDLSKSDDKFAVMEKYFYNDDVKPRRNSSKMKATAFKKALLAIAAQIRQSFIKNILVLTSPREDDEQKILEAFFEYNFKNCGLYILRSSDTGYMLCTETFSLMNNDLKTATELTDFVKQYNITEIFAERPLKFNAPFIKNWLSTCGLPVKTFSQNKK